MDFESSLLEIREYNNTLKTFSFAKPAILDFEAGQFLLLSFDADFKNSHPFSICSTPEDPVIEVTVRKLGNFTQKLFSSPIGTPVWIRAAYGAFTIKKEKGDIVMISGGVGITPFMSMIRHECHSGLNRKITLLCCMKNEKDIPDKQILDKLSRENENLEVTYIYSGEAPPGWTGLTGRISKEIICDKVKDILNKPFFLCGPPPLVQFLKQALPELGVPAEKIHVDNWEFASRIAKGE